MRTKRDIICKAPVTEGFLHAINTMQIQTLCDNDKKLHRVKITAQTDSSPILPEPKGVATTLSCGVDSLYSVKCGMETEYKSLKLTHLYIGSSGSFSLGQESNIAAKIHAKAQQCAEDLGLPLIKTRSNIHVEFPQGFGYVFVYTTFFGILAFKKLLKTFYYPSGVDFSLFNVKDTICSDPSYYDLLSVNTLSEGGFRVYSQGGGMTRLKKTDAISEFEAARKHLHVCFHKAQNCGVCQKCRRTLLMLDTLGKLDCFTEVFDIERYRKNKGDHVNWLVSRKETDVFAPELYEYFAKYEPELIKKAEEKAQQDKQKKEIHDKEALQNYDAIRRFYDFQVELLEKEPSPKRFLEEFFQKRGITKLLCYGTSKVGLMVMELLKRTSIEITYAKAARDIPKDVENILLISTGHLQYNANYLRQELNEVKIFTLLDILK